MKDITSYNDKGKPHGCWEWYYNTGNYLNDKQIDYWEIYNPNGNIETKIFFI